MAVSTVAIAGANRLESPGPPQRGAFTNASLYVGDLDAAVHEDDLYDLFSRIGGVASVRLCRDAVTRASLGYGYVNFNTPQEASRALEVLNFTLVRGKPIRIMFVNRDPSIRKSGLGNIFIKNLDSSIDNKTLHEIFSSFGTLLSCKVAIDENGISKGYGYVQFEKEESAKAAIDNLNGMLINDKEVYVGIFRRRQERDQANGSPKFTNVYVNNLSETTTEDDILKIFSQYGTITSAVVMKDVNGHSKGFGFVNYQNPDDAARAVATLNGNAHNSDKIWYVGRAQTRSERNAELKAKYEHEKNERFQKTQGANLYLKNLEDDIDDDRLKELFSEFGNITSCKVMVDSQGHSKGYGFVAFSSPHEAHKAMTEMNAKMMGKKPLYVAIAQRKEERRAKLQAQFSQLRAPGVVASTIPPNLPGYPATPRLAPQQLYFSQGSTVMIPAQPAGYGFQQQQFMPGMRPAMAPNFVMPYNFPRQGQPGQRFRRNGPPHHLSNSQRNNQGFRNMQVACNGYFNQIPQGFVGSVVPLPLDASGMQSIPGTSFASDLARAPPESRQMILGEQLFPLVEQIERDYAGKVTGMLLEMDQTEVLHLIESPDALKKKVGEALEVLRGADQLGTLSLNV